MIPVRKSVVLNEGGAAVDLLLTPHLYSFKERFGIDFSADLKNNREVMENYADVAFLGAVNAWVLDGKGTVDDFPWTRGDFHAWAASCPAAFGKFVAFAVSALTGKTAAELVGEKDESAKKKDEAKEEDEDGKKKRTTWIGRLLKRFS